ncbi:peptidase MA family metallohydrolase [Desmospora activa]|uniref:Peptidase MA-like domain-containing protein n=1 Tax=Desmospora activa DSM 45169 TaxID=1121389 RepID=A0A2T4Z4Q1_9BACL|nr:hypothetical protein [Desmospora activa]PTM56868.1 hypothetical protein C8J48_3193 [Desmospora activa DSM 45169]
MVTNTFQTHLRAWLCFFLSSLLVFAVGYTHYGKMIAQPVLHQSNHWWEAWRFRDGHVIEGSRAHVYYRSSDMKAQGQLVAAEADRVLRTFEQEYNFTPTRPVPVFLFPDRESLQNHFSWSHAQSATGVYFSGSIYLLNPEIWYRGFPRADENPQEWAQLFREKGPLVHEVAHLYLDRVTGGNYPLWYTEAFAQWVEYDQLGYEWVVPANRLNDRALYSYDDLRNRFDQLDNQALAYRQSFLLVRHMVEEQGEDKLDHLHRLLGRGIPFETAWEQIYGETAAESHRRWLE